MAGFSRSPCSSPNFGQKIGLILGGTISYSDLCYQIFWSSWPPLFKILRTLLYLTVVKKVYLETLQKQDRNFKTGPKLFGIRECPLELEKHITRCSKKWVKNNILIYFVFFHKLCLIALFSGFSMGLSRNWKEVSLHLYPPCKFLCYSHPEFPLTLDWHWERSLLQTI